MTDLLLRLFIILITVFAVTGCGDESTKTPAGSTLYGNNKPVPEWTCATETGLTVCRLYVGEYDTDPSKVELIPPCRPVASVLPFQGGPRGRITSVYAYCQADGS